MINPFTGNRFENNDHFLVQFLLALVFAFVGPFIKLATLSFTILKLVSSEFLCLRLKQAAVVGGDGGVA